MRVRRFTETGGRKREPELDCTAATSAGGAGTDWLIDVMIRTEPVDMAADPVMVATLRLDPGDACELAARLVRHATWCRASAECERTCGPQRISGEHVAGCKVPGLRGASE